MATWTKEELEALYPHGTVTRRHNHDTIVLTTEEWSAWVDKKVGTEKPEEEVE